jgi:flavodoxin
MKILFLTASAYGNTATIAGAMAEALANNAQVKSVTVDSFTVGDLEGIHLLIVSSPTQKFNPLPELTQLLKELPSQALDGIHVAAFDTRFTEQNIEKVRILALFVKIFGYAAASLGKILVKKGGTLLVAPLGFYVTDVKGPLLDGELQRARNWARDLYQLSASQTAGP